MLSLKNLCVSILWNGRTFASVLVRTHCSPSKTNKMLHTHTQTIHHNSRHHHYIHMESFFRKAQAVTNALINLQKLN